MVGFLIAIFSGILMSVQGVFNTQVTKTTGMWVGNAWVQLSAFLVCIHAEVRARSKAQRGSAGLPSPDSIGRLGINGKITGTQKILKFYC